MFLDKKNWINRGIKALDLLSICPCILYKNGPCLSTGEDAQRKMKTASSVDGDWMKSGDCGTTLVNKRALASEMCLYIKVIV